MNKGDTLRLNFDFVDDDGNPLMQGQFEEMELQLNPDRLGVYSMKFLLSAGDILWDEDEQKFYVLVSQEDSLKLPNNVLYQLRCMDSGTVISSDISSFDLGKVLSRQVLDVN